MKKTAMNAAASLPNKNIEQLLDNYDIILKKLQEKNDSVFNIYPDGNKPEYVKKLANK